MDANVIAMLLDWYLPYSEAGLKTFPQSQSVVCWEQVAYFLPKFVGN